MKTRTNVRSGAFYTGRGTGGNKRSGIRTVRVAKAWDTTGCFVEGTRIRLSDGTDLAVERFTGTEQVSRSNGTFSPVAHGRSGPEVPPVLTLTTESGHRLGVTRTHPMVVQRPGMLEILAASQLRVGDLLLVTEGAGLVPSRVTSLEWNACRGRVYNFALEGVNPHDHFLVANGIVTGDLVLQGEVERTQTAEPARSQAEAGAW